LHTYTHRYEVRLSTEREASLRLKGENGIMRKKFNALQKDIEAQKEEIKNLFEQVRAHTPLHWGCQRPAKPVCIGAARGLQSQHPPIAAHDPPLVRALGCTVHEDGMDQIYKMGGQSL